MSPIPSEHLPIPSQRIPQNPLEYGRDSVVLSESQRWDPAAKFQAWNPRILAPLLQSEPFHTAFGCWELFGNGFQGFGVDIFFPKEYWSGSNQFGFSRYFFKAGNFAPFPNFSRNQPDSQVRAGIPSQRAENPGGKSMREEFRLLNSGKGGKKNSTWIFKAGKALPCGIFQSSEGLPGLPLHTFFPSFPWSWRCLLQVGMEKMTTGAWNSSQKPPELRGIAASRACSAPGAGRERGTWNYGMGAFPVSKLGIFGKNGNSLHCCVWDKTTWKEFWDKEREFLGGWRGFGGI